MLAWLCVGYFCYCRHSTFPCFWMNLLTSQLWVWVHAHHVQVKVCTTSSGNYWLGLQLGQQNKLLTWWFVRFSWHCHSKNSFFSDINSDVIAGMTYDSEWMPTELLVLILTSICNIHHWCLSVVNARACIRKSKIFSTNWVRPWSSSDCECRKLDTQTLNLKGAGRTKSDW